MSDDLDSFEAEGIQAFTRLTGAVQDLGGRLASLDAGLGAKVATAEWAATSTTAAAQNAKQAAEHAAAIARAGARSAIAWAVLGALAGVLGAGGAGYWLGHASGRDSGLADGYRAALDQNAAASWANTPSGRLALAMDQTGSLALVAACSGKGWQLEKRQGSRICFPQPVPDGSPRGTVYGWSLP